MGEPPLLDEVTDLKLNSLEVVGAVSQRRALLQVWHQNHERMDRDCCAANLSAHMTSQPVSALQL